MIEQGRKASTLSEVFIDRTLDKLMGDIVDWGKMSEMSERAYTQFEKSVKINFNNLRKLYKEKLVLKEEVNKIDQNKGGS